jgi:hypothetical protein
VSVLHEEPAVAQARVVRVPETMPVVEPVVPELLRESAPRV